MESKRKIQYKITIFLLIATMLIFPFFSTFVFTSHAKTDAKPIYSSVLEDLEKSESFDIGKYPIVIKDYSLQFIQIAESSDNELFIYVYQPSGNDLDLRATSINLATDENLDYKHYELEYLNSYTTLYKYKVVDFTVSSEEERYYNIASIFRKWDVVYDGSSELELEKSFSVGQVVQVSGFGKDVTYSYRKTEVVPISAKKALNVVCFDNSFFSWMTPGENGYCSHVVLFSTDWQIDKVIEAKVYAEYQYSTYTYNKHGVGYFPEDVTEEPYSTYITRRYDEKVSVSENGNTYTFNRIMTSSEYLSALGDSAESYKEDFEGYDWVLCISEASDFFSYSYTGVLYGYEQIGGTLLQSATILELTFDMGGEIYSLGVVDNLSSADAVVDSHSWLDDVMKWFNSLSLAFKILIGIVVGALLLIVIYFVFKLLKLAIEAINNLFKGG